MNARVLGIVCAASALLLVATAAEAKPRRVDAARQAERERVLAPLEAAATACFADTIDANPTALGHAKAGRWYEAASVGGYLCRPEVAKLMRAHDVFDGNGAGTRYFRGPYVRRLGAALAAKLEPDLTRHAVADALPPAETVKASAGDADVIPAETTSH